MQVHVHKMCISFILLLDSFFQVNGFHFTPETCLKSFISFSLLMLTLGFHNSVKCCMCVCLCVYVSVYVLFHNIC
jgi:hypothetical protein